MLHSIRYGYDHATCHRTVISSNDANNKKLVLQREKSTRNDVSSHGPPFCATGTFGGLKGVVTGFLDCSLPQNQSRFSFFSYLLSIANFWASYESLFYQPHRTYYMEHTYLYTYDNLSTHADIARFEFRLSVFASFRKNLVFKELPEPNCPHYPHVYVGFLCTACVIAV